MGKMGLRQKTEDSTIYIPYTLIQCCPLRHWRPWQGCDSSQGISPLGIENLQILFLLIPRLLPLRPVHGFLRQVLLLDSSGQKIFHHLSNSALKYGAAVVDFEPYFTRDARYYITTLPLVCPRQGRNPRVSVISDCLVHRLGSPWAEPQRCISIHILVTMIFYSNAL